MEDKRVSTNLSKEENVQPLNKKLAIALVSVFMAILILPTILWGAIGLISKQTQSDLSFDTGENRALSVFPTEFDMQKFPSQVEAWYNDHLPFRSVLYQAQSNMKTWIERAYKNAILPPTPTPDEGENNGGGQENPEPTPPQDFPLIFNDNQKVFYGRGDWLFYGAENSLDYYKGTNLMDGETLAKETASIIRLKELCDERGIELRIFIAPNKERVYSEYMPTVPIADEYRRVDRFVDYIKSNTDVEVVFPIQDILDAKKYAQLYYKYDTHWNEAGAFFGTNALYRSLGLREQYWDELTVREYTRSTGDLLSMGGIDKNNYKNDKGYTVTYKNGIKVTATTGSSLEGQTGSQTVFYTSNSSNNQRLFMVGDSFRGSMLPYMQKDFAQITATGRLYLGQEDVIAQLLCADVLVVEAVERYDFTISVMADLLIKNFEANPI